MAFGDISLTASMRANLVSLQQTSDLLGRTQERLATNKKVNSALDNPASFFAAREATQRAGLLSGLKDNIGEAIQQVKVADTGVKAMVTLIEGLRGQLSQARNALGEGSTSATSLATIATQYNSIIKQMDNISQVDASYKGINFLKSDSVTVNFNEKASTSLTLTGFDGSTGGLLISGGNAAGTPANGTLAAANINSNANIQLVEDSLNNALTTLRTESAKLANNLTIMSTRQEFITGMVNNLQEGADKLTLADSNEEGANLLALQTRQQLSTTALSLASQAAQSVLRLF